MDNPAFPVAWKRAICVLLIIAGLALYLYWGIMYGAWYFLAVEYVGLYGLMLAFIGIGVVGLLILRWETEDAI
ncbi:MAG: hypothetical protein PWQ88_800 [Candidatus Methanomethylophilaceae archaeon]|nr:hypothetical protein [Candidatus Methanomethylophilaceae archaeon]MDI3541196.1 hypothetical protein [Candidatus Methanomethylophilaceae archaeon]HIJ00040.1 hypothetical protein [Candidatus Methanomethylophilaceae archaeon]